MSFKIKKQNWKLYAAILFLFLVYWFLSVQKNYYLPRDLIAFGFKENLLLAVLILLITLPYFYKFNDDEKDSFIRVSKTFMYAIFTLFYSFFIIKSVIISSGLLINRMYAKETVSEKFEITYVMSNRNVEMRSLNDSSFVVIKNKFTDEGRTKIKKGDVITIIFDKGVLEKKFIKTKIVLTTKN